LDPGGADVSPNGEWVIRGNPLRLVERASGKFRSFPGARGGNPRFSRDGQSIYTNVLDPGEPSHWRLSLTDGKTSQLTKLDGPRGRLGWVFSADDRYLYFTWYDDEGDIWVMDVGRTLSDDVP
jgi:Tol biopolymer transport system component